MLFDDFIGMLSRIKCKNLLERARYEVFLFVFKIKPFRVRKPLEFKWTITFDMEHINIITNSYILGVIAKLMFKSLIKKSQG